MTLRFEMAGRKSSTGFVLLDALIAFAIAALALTTLLMVMPNLAGRLSDRMLRHQATEFAYSLMEDYRVTGLDLEKRGEDPSGWSWEIAEGKPGGPPDGGLALHFVEVTIITWRSDRPELRVTMNGSVARREE